MGNNNPPPLILITAILLLISSHETISEANEDGEAKFSYLKGAENGPEKWGKLSPNYTVCNAGDMQSPINIDDSSVEVTTKLGQLIRRYRSAPAVIINRGHAIQIKWTGDAGKIMINGTEYHTEQCHWHTPSENTVNGKRFDMELHLVHKNARDEIAAISILYKIGTPDKFLGKLVSSVKQVDHSGKDIGILNPGKITYGSRKYYRFTGSLTVPPCSQGVIWTIVTKTKTVSREQIYALKEAVDDGYEENARPVQPLNGRIVYLNQP